MENLKLPLCPKCGDTKYVSKTIAITWYPWFGCDRCNIEWSYGLGIRQLSKRPSGGKR